MVQLYFHSLEVYARIKPIFFCTLACLLRSLAAELHFLEGYLQLSKPLKLQAESTPESPERRHQGHLPVPRLQRDITLRQQVVAVGYRLPPPRPKLRKLLPDRN